MSSNPSTASVASHGRQYQATGAGPLVQVRDLVKHFRRANGTVANAIDGVSFDVMPGEFVVLLGPSGCGKTTLLRSLAGLEKADSGEITIRDQKVYSSTQKIELAPERRNLSMIFQSYALWPHMTGFKNVAYPLQSQKGVKLPKVELRDRVEKALTMVGVPELMDQYPNQMSGGQQQRVALARALVRGDDLILFDEPLSNVDAKVRESLRRELLEMQRDLGFAAIYVTHDQNEAMELAHRVAVMGEGKVRQLATPQEVYLEPTSRYVSKFVGNSNEIPGEVTSVTAQGVVVSTELGELHGIAGHEGISVGMKVVASFRPEQATLSTSKPSAKQNVWQGTVDRLLFLGTQTEHNVLIQGVPLRLVTLGISERAQGDSTWVSVNPHFLRVFAAD